MCPTEEDFGLVAVEAQAAGRPVIAYGVGGARESVVGRSDPETLGRATGLWFEPQTPEALADAVRRFEAVEAEFDAGVVRAHAERFGPERFRSEIRREIECARAEV